MGYMASYLLGAIMAHLATVKDPAAVLPYRTKGVYRGGHYDPIRYY